jgi:hypothetical protein
MRALCGAIIAAGAMIGLGLLNIGIGYRYAGLDYYHKTESQDSGPVIQFMRLKDLDAVFLVSLVALLVVLAIGLGIAFLGLAYHHHRRGVELLHLHRQALGVPGSGPPDRPSERVTV